MILEMRGAHWHSLAPRSDKQSTANSRRYSAVSVKPGLFTGLQHREHFFKLLPTALYTVRSHLKHGRVRCFRATPCPLSLTDPGLQRIVTVRGVHVCTRNSDPCLPTARTNHWRTKQVYVLNILYV